MKTQVSLRLNVPLLPILVILLLVVQFIAPYDGWLFLLVGLGGAWLLSFVWARSLARNLEIRREMRFGWAQVGDRLEERFTLINHGWIPVLWAEVVDHSTLPGYAANRAVGIGSLSQNQWRTGGLCTRRGQFQLGPTSLRASDPLGVYTVVIHNSNQASLLVTPPVIPLPYIEVAPGGRSGEGRPRPDAPERTVSVSGVREYLPGDSLRDIHWRTSARRDELFVRLFEGMPSSDWWILLDLDRRVQAGRGEESTAEHGVILAASLAARGLGLKRAVGLAANSRPLIWSAAREGDGQRWEILRSLAVASSGDHSLAELLARLKPAFGRRSSLILITANTSGDWIPALLPLVWNGAVPTILLLDPAAYGGTGDPGGLLQTLGELGFQRYLITPALFDRPEARPGQKGRLDFKVSPRGRAIPVGTPRDGSWRALS